VTFLFAGFALFVALFFVWRVWFLRDPRRTVPPGESVLAPADGFVTYVKRVSRGTVPIAVKGRREIPLSEIVEVPGLDGEGVLVGIFMTAFSVHRNRAPVSGEVVFRRRRPAPKNRTMARMMTRFLLRAAPYEDDCDYLVENERLTIALRNERGLVAVTQIADKWIDRIVARVEVGDCVERGALYGLIRFGSQVDLFLPDSYGVETCVRPGQYVRAGESEIAVRSARMREAGPEDNSALLSLLRSHPIRMEVSYVMDRAPDFFRLHRRHTGSRVIVADDGHSVPAACISMLRYETRDGTIHYLTDLIRRPGSGLRGIARKLGEEAVRLHRESGVPTVLALVNEKNERALRSVPWISRSLETRVLAHFDYVELVPLRRRHERGRFPANPAELEDAVRFIDRAYARHRFYRSAVGFGPDEVVIVRRGRIVAAAVVCDPSSMVTIRVDRFGLRARLWAEGLRYLHRVTGRFPEPPRLGGAIRSLHVRYVACERGAEADLFGTLNDLALDRGAHTLTLLRDRREPLRIPGLLGFRYGSILFGAAKDEARDDPVFFDVTLA